MVTNVRSVRDKSPAVVSGLQWGGRGGHWILLRKGTLSERLGRGHEPSRTNVRGARKKSEHRADGGRGR